MTHPSRWWFWLIKPACFALEYLPIVFPIGKTHVGTYRMHFLHVEMGFYSNNIPNIPTSDLKITLLSTRVNWSCLNIPPTTPESIGMAQNSAVTTQIWWLTSQSIKMAMLVLIWWYFWWLMWWLIWWLSILICIKMAMLGLVRVLYPYFQTQTFKPWFSKAVLLFWSPWSKQ